jgi:hypothetical protein
LNLPKIREGLKQRQQVRRPAKHEHKIPPRTGVVIMLKAKNLKYCERCHIQFECKVTDIANCQCSKVSISNEIRVLLKAAHQDCLCTSCLLELANTYSLKINLLKNPIN